MNAFRLFRVVVLFVMLAVAGVLMVVLSQDSAQQLVRSTLPFLGSALFASGLTFFLIEVTCLYPDR
jgi:hypothetical protein